MTLLNIYICQGFEAATSLAEAVRDGLQDLDLGTGFVRLCR